MFFYLGIEMMMKSLLLMICWFLLEYIHCNNSTYAENDFHIHGTCMFMSALSINVCTLLHLLNQINSFSNQHLSNKSMLSFESNVLLIVD